jgi:2-polyprenyl-3-methyl-5-hydroxy-6-metoxy-1,4-benzoquinol methylase
MSDRRQEEIHDCCLCGTEGVVRYRNLEDRLFTAPGRASLMQCRTCGLWWLTPRFTREHIAAAYSSYYTHQVYDGPRRFAAIRRRVADLLERHATRGVRRRISERLLAGGLWRVAIVRDTVDPLLTEVRGRKPGWLIDVGCGTGEFLDKMRRLGWEVLGVEPDPAAAALARARFALRVLDGTLEDQSLPSGSHELVVSRHVLEHVHDPVAFLGRCFDLVKPGGNLVVLTPNMASLQHKIFGASWVHLDPPRHLHLFTRATLATCAARAGVMRTTIRTLAREGRAGWQASRLIHRLGRTSTDIPLSLKLEGMAAMLFVECTRWFWRDAGDELMLVASKPHAGSG